MSDERGTAQNGALKVSNSVTVCQDNYYFTQQTTQQKNWAGEKQFSYNPEGV